MHTVAFDTWSGFTWIADRECLFCDRYEINKYFSCNESKTCVEEDEDRVAYMNYGSGKIMGDIVQEQIYYGDKKLRQNILLVKDVQH
jgi:hypothetical protein